jgi:hypothetical protein
MSSEREVYGREGCVRAEDGFVRVLEDGCACVEGRWVRWVRVGYGWMKVVGGWVRVGDG